MRILLQLIKIIFLLPFSLLYAVVVLIRNKFFDWGWSRSTSFSLPVICVGNITVGGTGKTPHIEYLLQALSAYPYIAVLSRGYKRKTKGFCLVETDSTPQEVGDEPFQMKTNFPEVTVAVDADRVEGINCLLSNNAGLQAVLLDDAFQHRRVKPSFSIVLVDYNRPVDKDFFLPYGRLRDSRSQLKRAQVVIITKCPVGIGVEEQKKFRTRLKLSNEQLLCFSVIDYGELMPVFKAEPNNNTNALALTGIANPKPFVEHLRQKFMHVDELAFPDHHFFTEKDIDKITAFVNSAPSMAIVTTQKDAVRFQEMGDKIPVRVQQRMYYIPIRIRFIAGEEQFLNTLYNHVESNSGNSKFYKEES